MICSWKTIYKTIQDNHFPRGQDSQCEMPLAGFLKLHLFQNSKATASKVAIMTFFVLLLLIFAILVTQALFEQRDVRSNHSNHKTLSTSLQHLFNSSANHTDAGYSMNNNNNNNNNNKNDKNFNKKNEIGIKRAKRYYVSKIHYIKKSLQTNQFRKQSEVMNDGLGNVMGIKKNHKDGNQMMHQRKLSVTKIESKINKLQYMEDSDQINLNNNIENKLKNINNIQHLFNKDSVEFHKKDINNPKSNRDQINYIRSIKRFKRNSEQKRNYYNYGYSRIDDDDSEGSGDDWEDEGRCCGYKEVVRQTRIEGIKSDILHQLKLSEPPDVSEIDEPFVQTIVGNNEGFSSQAVQAQPTDDAIYWSNDGSMALKADDDHAATSRAFFFCEDFPDIVNTNGVLYFYCFFKIREILRNHHVPNATMGVFVKKANPLEASDHDYPRLYSESILLESINADQTVSYVEKKLIRWDNDKRGNWFEFNIGEKIKEWQENPQSNQGLKVSIQVPSFPNLTTNSFNLVPPKSTIEPQHRPYLDLKLAEKTIRREDNRKRRALERDEGSEYGDIDDICNENTPNKSCCRFPLLVNFTEIKWNFIVQPKHYQAYYCAGFCGTGAGQSSSHNHLIEQTIRSYSSDHNTNGLCCAPRSFAPLQVLYFDENRTALSEVINSMIVQRCGCF